MSYKYTHFIPENTAPKGAKRIGVYQGERRICTVPLGRLAPVEKAPLYSFGLISDIHLWKVNSSAYSYSNEKLDSALSYFESKNCAFCVVCGDLTITGFYLRTDDSDASTQSLDEDQFAQYKEICEKHTVPVYELMGNHESYYGMPITNNLDKMEKYTGKGELSYTVAHGNDLLILCGQNNGSSVMSDADFTWLGRTLEDNKDKRCFVFVHPYIEEDSGDAMDVRENSIFDYWGTSETTAFINLLQRYNNAILFHGHSHMKFECQELDVNANYTERNGFKSVHVPSSASPRYVVFDEATNQYKSANDNVGSQGYIVDVYDDCIVLNGLDFASEKPVPLGVYKLDTALKTVEADTFTDDTGIIVT